MSSWEEVEQRFEATDYEVVRKAFGEAIGTIYDFELFHYQYLLDTALSINDLAKGLQVLSPFADDALEVIKSMTNVDFQKFREALEMERTAAVHSSVNSNFPNQWMPVLIPFSFIKATLLAERAEVPLGAVLLRVLEIDSE